MTLWGSDEDPFGYCLYRDQVEAEEMRLTKNPTTLTVTDHDIPQHTTPYFHTRTSISYGAMPIAMPYHTFHALHFLTNVTLHYLLCNIPIHRVESHCNIAFLHCIVVHIEGCSKLFHVEMVEMDTSADISFFFRQTWAKPMFIFSGTCCPSLVRKALVCDLLKFVPGACSPVTLHSVAGALKDIRLL